MTNIELGRKLCEVLGLDPKQVMAISINCRAFDVSTVSVELFMNKEVVRVFEEYELVKR